MDFWCWQQAMAKAASCKFEIGVQHMAYGVLCGLVGAVTALGDLSLVHMWWISGCLSLGVCGILVVTDFGKVGVSYVVEGGVNIRIYLLLRS